MDLFPFIFLKNQLMVHNYIDGVSITYGSPRKHIWTYGIGISDLDNATNCPCTKIPGTLPASFVHDNYYCESGSLLRAEGIFTDEPVWNGESCSNDNSCCSDPNMPWLYCLFPLTTSEHKEIRIFRDEAASNEDILVKELQLYMQ